MAGRHGVLDDRSNGVHDEACRQVVRSRCLGTSRRLGVALELITCVEPTSADGLPWGDRDVIDSGYLVRRAREHGASSWEILHGKRPGPAVAAHAQGRAGLIVASTHGRSGLARIVTGSVAVRIVHQAPCPVLLVRPDGLAEPIQG